MASDPGIFAQANKPTTALIDPNTMLMQTAQAANAVNQNRLFQANQARGQLMQQAIDPSTGQFSPTAFNRLLAQTPAAALAAPEAVGQSQGLMGSQNELATRQNQFMSQSLGAVLATPDAQLHDAAANAMTRAVSAGLLPPEQAMRQMIMLPNDPTQLRQHLTQVQMSLLPPGAQQEATYGSPSTRDTGQGIESGTTAPARLGGGFTPNSTTQVYPSRSQLIGQQTGVDPVTGAPTASTTADRAAQQGRDDLTGPAGTPPGRMPSALLPKGYTGRYAAGGRGASSTPPDVAPTPAAPAGMSSGVPYTPPATPAAPSGSVQVGLAPGQAEEAQSSVSHLAQARDAANTYATRIQPLMAAQAALKDAKTGSGSEVLNSVRQALQNFTPAALDGFRPAGGSAEQDAAFDEARKYLTNYAANTPGANRSDAGGQTAANANANVHISPLAAQQVVRAAIGLERMRQAQTMEFNQSGQTGATYDKYQSAAATKADPRAFIADQQTPDERKAMLGKMTPPQQANYIASLRLGMKHGLVSLGGN